MTITIKYETYAVAKRKPESLLFVLSILWKKSWDKKMNFATTLY